ncbi:MAG: SMC family ATPase [Clostridium sp.]|nr:SMC family ATPase [Clostridium sp.]
MKPISITMQGFGSYIQSATIDFSSLGENPIFLITGATGGGKTTILDAMCFALYCKATGGRRSWSSMRSTAAEDSLSTSVDFSFQLGSEVYRFYRSQSVYYVRGSGRRDIREEHICYRLTDGLPTDKNAQWELLVSGSETKVRDYAQRLLGLTCEQFSQVIVLPQGDFLKLLRANSNGKAEILQTLFATQIWSQITDKMKQHANTLSKEVGELYATKNALLEREEVETVEALEEKCIRNNAALLTSQTELKQLQKTVAHALEQLNQAKELQQKMIQKKELERKQINLQDYAPAIEEKKKLLSSAKQIEQIYPYWQNYQTSKKSSIEKQASYQTAQQVFQQAQLCQKQLEDQQENILNQKEQIVQMEKILPDLERSIQTLKRIDALNIQQKEMQEIIEKKDAEQSQIQLQITQIEERMQKGTLYLQSIDTEYQKLPEYKEQLLIFQTYEQQYLTWSQIKTEHEKAKQIFDSSFAIKQEKEHIISQKQEQISHIQTAVLEQTALAMAQELQENKPCPVCGSLHHPAPALQNSLEQTDTAQLSAFRAELEQLQTDYQQYLQTFSHAQAVLDEKISQLKAASDACQKIPTDYEQLQIQIMKQKEQIQKSEALIATRKKSEERLQTLSDEQSRLKETYEQKREEIAFHHQQLAVIEASIKELNNSIQLPNGIINAKKEWNNIQCTLKRLKENTSLWDTKWMEACSKIAVEKANLEHAASVQAEAIDAEEKSKQIFTKQLETVENMLNINIDSDLEPLRISVQERQELEHTIQDYTTQVQTILQQLHQLTIQLQGQAEPNIVPLETDYIQLQQQHDALSLKIGAQTQQLENTKKALSQLQKITSNSKETEAQYEQASRLHQLLSGGNSKKIPLQQFILGIMLDDILTYANEFFSLLSRGRYSLRRLEGSIGGNAKSGLDLEVLDGFTGAPRSIETLSGGEQFLASLSLAFGLSDVVQSYSGSVRLDSIFIDEGFGSLDQDTLDTAMKALSQIQKMGRTVGIISHVSELKNRIATQIQVHPSKNGGSSITIVKDV